MLQVCEAREAPLSSEVWSTPQDVFPVKRNREPPGPPDGEDVLWAAPDLAGQRGLDSR